MPWVVVLGAGVAFGVLATSAVLLLLLHRGKSQMPAARRRPGPTTAPAQETTP
jgi:hypothetical protein